MPTEWFLCWFLWTVAVGRTNRMQHSMMRGPATALQIGSSMVLGLGIHMSLIIPQLMQSVC